MVSFSGMSKGEAATGVITSGTPSSSATRIFVLTPVVRSTGTIISRHESTSVRSSSELRYPSSSMPFSFSTPA